MWIRIFILIAILPFSATAAEIVATRTSGVAPLGVQFHYDDALVNSSGGTQSAFHTYLYSWDFDDTVENWGTTGAPKNTDTGPIAAHMFETAGTFTVSVDVINSTGTVATDTIEITVSDPDTVYSGTDTICISTTTDFTGCPSGASQITTTNINTAMGNTATDKRVLLRRGSSWSAGSQLSFAGNGDGPTTVGAFGTCTSPDAKGICTNAPQITATFGGELISLESLNDWRIMDIKLVGNGAGNAIYGWTENYRNTILRMKMDNFVNDVEISRWRVNDVLTDHCTQLFFVDNHFGGGVTSGGYGFYINGEQINWLGNDMQGGGQHTVRVEGTYKSLFAHNTAYHASFGTNYGGQALYWQGYDDTSIGTYASNTGDRNKGSRVRAGFNVVTGNIFGGSGPQMTQFQPQNDEEDERQLDTIIEKNTFMNDYGPDDNGGIQEGLRVAAEYVSIRNNIFDSSGGLGYGSAVVIYQGTMVDEDTVGITVYNNTFYRSDSPGEWYAYAIENSTVVLRNNLVSASDVGDFNLLHDYGGNTLTQSNNVVTDTPYFTDPDDATPDDRDFSLTASSTDAIEHGYTVPVYDDFISNARTENYDVGAHEYTTIVDEPVLSGSNLQGSAIR